MSHDLGSRSDLEALRRSGRGKLALLGVMLLSALAAAGWWFFGKQEGIGSREDPTKVLVVRTGRLIGYAAVLEGNGFDAAEGDLAYWVEKAKAQVPELEVDGIQAVMQLADQFGYGYVVFEEPAEVDFGPLELEDVPEFEDHVMFAVLSVGDFAFPPVMTVNPEPSAAIRSTEISLLQALFEQEQLAGLLPGAEESVLGGDIGDIQLRDKLEDALEELDKLPAAEKLAERVLGDARRLLVEEERGEPRPTLVGEALEDGVAVPLPSGEVLAWSRGLRVVTRDAVQVDLEQVEAELLLHRAADGTAEDRQRCTALAGGEIATTEAVKIDFAVDGSAVLVRTLTDGSNLWVYQPGTPCGFENRGAVPPASAGYDGPLVPHASGKVAQAGFVDGVGQIRIATAGVAGEVVLGKLAGIELGNVVWLDAEHLAALGEGPSVFFFSVAHPHVVLELDGSAFEGAMHLGEIAIGGSKRDLLVTAGNEPRKLFRLGMPAEPAQLFAAPPELEVTPVAGEGEDAMPEGRGAAAKLEALAREGSIKSVGEPVHVDLGAPDGPTGQPASPIVELDPAKFVVEALTHEGNVANPVASPDGKRIAFAILERSLDRPDAADDEEIAILSLAGGGLRVLTRNALTDGQPRFTADGRHIVFLTRAQIPKTRWEVTVPRIVPVGD